mmetsp:Transcript_47659/g.137183  ORF Transcript_47659/g.137183 Transcript_47659/m.137183 type:complete len:679 (-) Transcript_47659:59-2095(-)
MAGAWSSPALAPAPVVATGLAGLPPSSWGGWAPMAFAIARASPSRRGVGRAPRLRVAAEIMDPPSLGAQAGGSSSSRSASTRWEDEADSEPRFFQQFVAFLGSFVGSLLAARRPKSGKGQSNIVQQLGEMPLDMVTQSPLFSLGPVPRCTDASDLRRSGRHFTIITTAALPWLTGTAVNPLLRALTLAKGGRPVVLLLPWLEKEDQMSLFPNKQFFEDPSEQEEAINKWCRERAKIDPSRVQLQLRWYRAKYVKSVGSIFPRGDCSKELGEGDPKDVLILEEPEHLCWYHYGQRWPVLFNHVIGIVHTNYQEYLTQHKGGSFAGELVPESIKEASVYAASTLVCSAYCDVNIKLSDTIMPLPNEVTCNVHGVRDEFLRIGDRCGRRWMKRPSAVNAYYLGKCIFEKGWGELLDLLDAAGEGLDGVVIDGYGSGANEGEVRARAARLNSLKLARLHMHPGVDHADERLRKYSVLVNASTTDVLCTVTVEALAMGRRCVLARHPSNRFFQEHFADRCYFFDAGDVRGFVLAVREALAAGPPQPLPPEQRHALTWEAACERLFDSAEVRVLSGRAQRPSQVGASQMAYALHNRTAENTIIADLVKEATLGEKTPWDEYMNEWRRTQLAKMRETAEVFNPMQLKKHEEYLRERIMEFTTGALKLLPTGADDRRESARDGRSV